MARRLKKHSEGVYENGGRWVILVDVETNGKQWAELHVTWPKEKSKSAD